MSVPSEAIAPAPTWLLEVPFAHRGLHGDGVPENSIPAFEAAAEAEYGVELDVLLSRDGVPVVTHDLNLTRVAGRRARVGELTAAELAAIGLDGTDVGVPTLAAALDVLRDVPVMIEVKQVRPRGGRLERTIAALLDDHPGPCCVASFNPASVRWFRRQRPRIVRVLTASPSLDLRLPRVLRRRLAQLRDVPSVEPAAVSYELAGLPNPVTDGWREAGGALIAWTVTSDDELRRARTLADNVIFEGVRP